MAKKDSTVLSNALAAFPPPVDSDLLLGLETTDSAAVYCLSPDLASLCAVSVIPQPLADPYWFGQIAAAHALGKVYAFGGTPVTALHLIKFPGEQQKKGSLLEIIKLALFPSKQLDQGVFQEVLRGGHDKVVEAGACPAGGQFLHGADAEYGLCVNGTVHPDKMITPVGARSGDALILTKPLGAGVLLRAVRTGKYPLKKLEAETLPLLAALNNTALDTALAFAVHACAEVNEAGILGSLLNIARGAQARVVLKYKELAFYPAGAEMYKKGVMTDSNKSNRALLARHDLHIRTELSGAETELLYDPQISGGLVLALPKAQAADLLAALHKNRVKEAACIGEIVDEPIGIRVE